MEHFAFSCPVCYKAFDTLTNTPRIIPSCGHTLCSSCLDILGKTKNWTSITCPMDKKTHSIKVKDIEEFPKNFSLIYILEQRNLQRSNLGSDLKPCPLHEDILKFICITCKLQICAECAFDDSHSEHEIVPLEKLSKIVNRKLQDVEECIVQVESIKGDIKEQINDMIDLKRSSLIKEVEENFSILIDEISQCRDRTIKQLNDHLIGLKKKYEPKEEDTNKQLQTLKLISELKETLKKWRTEKNLEAGTYLYSEQASKDINGLKTSLQNEVKRELTRKLDECRLEFNKDFRKLAQSVVTFKSGDLLPPPLPLVGSNGILRPPPLLSSSNSRNLSPPLLPPNLLSRPSTIESPMTSVSFNTTVPNIVQNRQNNSPIIISSPQYHINTTLKPPNINLSDPSIHLTRTQPRNTLPPPTNLGNIIDLNKHIEYLSKDRHCIGACLYDTVSQTVVESRNFSLSANLIKTIVVDNYGTREDIEIDEHRQLSSLLSMGQIVISCKFWLNGEKWTVIQGNFDRCYYSLTNEKEKILCVGKAKKMVILAVYNKTVNSYKNIEDCMAKVREVQSTLHIQGL